MALTTATLETLNILSHAVKISGHHRQKSLAQTRVTILKSPDPSRTADHSGFEHSSGSHIVQICVRIIAPDASDLSGSIGIGPHNSLGHFAPETKPQASKLWSPRDFYNSVHVPKSGESPSTFAPIEKLRCKLYPFQERAIQWLLRREGIGVPQKSPEDPPILPHGFIWTTDAEGKRCLVSQFLGMATTNSDVPFQIGTDPKGGILAEEMGLGKTVEMIALICLHKYDQPQISRPSSQLSKSPATLIVTPPAILDQWINELRTLAPDLRVLHYRGLRVEAGTSNHQELLAKCMSSDVVLTTYNVLAKEIHYAEAPDRGLRHEKKYEKRLSPLTQTLWWRVVLDEAQMVESGVSNAAKVAKLIPRQLAWCVSGTPVKKDARDLFGLLDFLRYQPYCNLPSQSWDVLVAQYRSIFEQIFGNLALRHTKDQIKNEIQLPLQKRVVINVPFTQVEEQHYSTLFKQMSDDCGLDVDGAPLAEDWDPESTAVIEKMRTWLARLRQTCLHPEVGAQNRRALGNGKGPLRTVGEVLEVMIEQNDSAARSEERALLLSQIRRGQILEHAELSEEALHIWQDTLQQAKSIVNDCRHQLEAEIHRLGLTEDQVLSGDLDDIEGATALRTGPPRQRLRAAIEIEHICTFFVANAYFQIKTDETRIKPQSDEFYELERKEEASYEHAKALRKELLLEARKKADALISKINHKNESHSFTVLPQLPSAGDAAGIESRAYIDRLNDLIAVLQRQDKQLKEWRDKTMELLLLPLVDEEDTDLQGDEYETSTKQQDEVYVYVDALGALASDRHDIVTGQQNELIKHEMKVALRQAKEGQGHSPELFIRLLSSRNKLLPDQSLGSIRGLTAEVRELKTTLRSAVERGNSRAAAELLIVNGALHTLHKISTEQSKVYSFITPP